MTPLYQKGEKKKRKNQLKKLNFQLSNKNYLISMELDK